MFQSQREATYRFSQERVGDLCRGNRPPYSSIYAVLPRMFGGLGERGLLSSIYRALNHKSATWSAFLPARITYLPRHLEHLRNPLHSSTVTLPPRPLAHVLVSTYRALTHVSTVLSPMFSPLTGSVMRNFRGSSLQKLRSSYLLNSHTVLPPTFLPCFDPCCYRALTHRGTVPLPIELTRTTVFWPTKRSSKCSITQTISSLKDVLKTDIKNTSAAVMVFSLFGLGQSVSSRSHRV